MNKALLKIQILLISTVVLTGFSSLLYAESDVEPVINGTEPLSDVDESKVVEAISDAVALPEEKLTEEPQPKQKPSVKVIKPKIAIIIDDLGHNYQAGVDTINLKAPVAVAVLPFTRHSKKLAEYAHKNQQIVMLHLPMQPGAAMHLMTDKTLSIHMMQDEFDRNIHAMIEDVPHVIGVNNHMGSLFTQLPDQMQWLMNSLQSKSNKMSKELFFIDSLTSPYSVAYEVADKNNVATAKRDVFLDRELNAKHMQAQIERIKRKANLQGYAIAIGHPFPETLALLKKSIPELEAQGYEFVKITELLNTNAQRSASIQQIDNESQSDSIASSDKTSVATDKKKIAQVTP